MLFPMPSDQVGETAGGICTRERLGGLLKFYHREAACSFLTIRPGFRQRGMDE